MVCVRACVCSCSDGEISEHIKCRLAKASQVFGCLRHPIFANCALSVRTKPAVYQVTVLAVLLYGADTWTLKALHVRRLTVFQNHCVRTISGVTRYEQWQKRLTSATLLDRFRIEPIARIIMDRYLHCLGHVGCMDDNRLPIRYCCLGKKTCPWT